MFHHYLALFHYILRCKFATNQETISSDAETTKPPATKKRRKKSKSARQSKCYHQPSDFTHRKQALRKYDASLKNVQCQAATTNNCLAVSSKLHNGRYFAVCKCGKSFAHLECVTHGKDFSHFGSPPQESESSSDSDSDLSSVIEGLP